MSRDGHAGRPAGPDDSDEPCANVVWWREQRGTPPTPDLATRVLDRAKASSRARRDAAILAPVVRAS